MRRDPKGKRWKRRDERTQTCTPSPPKKHGCDVTTGREGQGEFLLEEGGGEKKLLIPGGNRCDVTTGREAKEGLRVEEGGGEKKLPWGWFPSRWFVSTGAERDGANDAIEERRDAGPRRWEESARTPRFPTQRGWDP